MCVITDTRVKYGLLYSLLNRFNEDNIIDVGIVVSGSRLFKRYGDTKKELYEDNFGHIFEIHIMGESSNYASSYIGNRQENRPHGKLFYDIG